MSLSEVLLGRPLRSEEQEAQKIGPSKGVPVLGLDALASAAYGPEAALTILIALGTTATAYIEPISAIIIALLVIVYLSYRQTIAGTYYCTAARACSSSTHRGISGTAASSFELRASSGELTAEHRAESSQLGARSCGLKSSSELVARGSSLNSEATTTSPAASPHSSP
jgi:hypothetical protein